MAPANVEKIEQGVKTTTIRSEKEANKINIPVGQSEVRTIGTKSYQVTNRGLLTIEEAGGREAMLKSEGVATSKLGLPSISIVTILSLTQLLFMSYLCSSWVSNMKFHDFHPFNSLLLPEPVDFRISAFDGDAY